MDLRGCPVQGSDLRGLGDGLEVHTGPRSEANFNLLALQLLGRGFSPIIAVGEVCKSQLQILLWVEGKAEGRF